MKVLFVCNQNQNRSRTAEEIFKDRFETRSAGLYNQKPLSQRELEWAEVVVVMEEAQRSEIATRFPKQYLQKRILSLDIPDKYHYNHPHLVRELHLKMKQLAFLFS